MHCSSVAPYVANVRGIPKLLDFGDMDSQKWLDIARHRPYPMKLVYWLEGQKLMAWEKRLAKAFDFCSVTTRGELDTLRNFNSENPSDFFPNGVDFDYFAPGDGYDPNSISFMGRMDYYPNQQAMIEFCREVLPVLRERVPEIKLSIIGAEPSAEIRALGNLPAVTVTGTVPDIPAAGAPLRLDGGSPQYRPRHTEQDAGIHGYGRASHLQPHRFAWRGRGRRQAPSLCPLTAIMRMPSCRCFPIRRAGRSFIELPAASA